jgi:replication-associated recombination protein RarA
VSNLFGRAPLVERYRPATWAEVVGQDKTVSKLLALKERNALAGRAYWLSGQSGTGKTTIARLIALEVADEFAVEELDSTALTVSRLREMEKDLSAFGWGDKAGRAVIVNEAHGLRKDVIRELLVVLERIPAHCAWIFTTTADGQESLFADYDDAAPLLSRCTVLPLARRDLAKAFAARAREIAQREGLDGQPIEKYLRLVQDCKNNLRAVLQEIEAGGMLS